MIVSFPGRKYRKGGDMIEDPRAVAARIRAASLSLTDPADIALVREYISELELLAAKREAAEARHFSGSGRVLDGVDRIASVRDWTTALVKSP